MTWLHDGHPRSLLFCTVAWLKGTTRGHMHALLWRKCKGKFKISGILVLPIEGVECVLYCNSKNAHSWLSEVHTILLYSYLNLISLPRLEEYVLRADLISSSSLFPFFFLRSKRILRRAAGYGERSLRGFCHVAMQSRDMVHNSKLIRGSRREPPVYRTKYSGMH